jgi:hypothetical protein
MASKSKGFKELVQEKKALQKKQQLAQKFMKKVESGEYGDMEAEIIVEPEGYEKMSAVLLKFLEPYLNTLQIFNHVRDYSLECIINAARETRRSNIYTITKNCFKNAEEY